MMMYQVGDCVDLTKIAILEDDGRDWDLANDMLDVGQPRLEHEHEHDVWPLVLIWPVKDTVAAGPEVDRIGDASEGDVVETVGKFEPEHGTT